MRWRSFVVIGSERVSLSQVCCWGEDRRATLRKSNFIEAQSIVCTVGRALTLVGKLALRKFRLGSDPGAM